jgi:glycogen operon protein
MDEQNWDTGFGRSIGVFLNGNGIQGRDARGRRVTDRNFAIFFNAHDDTVDFTLPPVEFSEHWAIVIDTAQQKDDTARSQPLTAGDVIPVAAKSVVVLRQRVHSGAA